MRKLLSTASIVTFAFLFLAVSDVSAHSCQNTNKKEGAGTEAIENNGGVAGFVERPGDEEVFIHPSVSQTENEELDAVTTGAPGEFENYQGHAGSLPEGAHDSEAWEDLGPPTP